LALQIEEGVGCQCNTVMMIFRPYVLDNIYRGIELFELDLMGEKINKLPFQK